MYLVEKLHDYNFKYANKQITTIAYNKKMMKKLYKDKDKTYTILGEYKVSHRKKPIGTFSIQDLANNKVKDKELNLYNYRAFSRFFVKEKAFVKVEGLDDTYIALLKYRVFLPLFWSLGLMALALILCVMLNQPKNECPDNNCKVAEVVPNPTPTPVEEKERFYKPIVENVNYTATPRGIDVQALPFITFRNGEAHEAAIAINNNTNIYQRVKCVLSDETVIALSDFIAPGETLKNLYLNEEGLKLEKGVYTGETVIEAYQKNENGEYIMLNHFPLGGQFTIK